MILSLDISHRKLHGFSLIEVVVTLFLTTLITAIGFKVLSDSIVSVAKCEQKFILHNKKLNKREVVDFETA